MPVDDDTAAAVNADQRTALDPSTDPQVLAAIAQHRPDLRAAVAMNPTTYPALLEWLAGLGDPVVNAALSTRVRATPAAPPVTTANPVATPEPDTAFLATGTMAPVRAKRRTGLLIGATAAVLVVAGGGYLATQLIGTPRPAANQVVDTITVGAWPEGLAVDPTSGSVYVANWGDGTVSVVDVATRQVIETITVGDSPIGVAVNADTGMVYVPKAGESGGVSVIDTTTRQVVDTIPLGDEGRPSWAAVDAGSGTVYVTNSDQDTVSVIDTTTNRVVDTITVTTPHQVVVDARAGLVYVTSAPFHFEDDVPVHGQGTVAVIDSATRQVVDTITVGQGPYGIAIDAEADIVYTTNTYEGTVSMIDTTANRVVDTITVDASPSGIAVDSRAGVVYVAHSSLDGGTGTVSVLDRATLQVVDTITAGANPHQLAVDAASGTVFVSNVLVQFEDGVAHIGEEGTVSVLQTH